MMNTPSSPEAAPRRPLILLVDDTPANIDVLVGLLKADYDLKVANRGERALKICAAEPNIDLILLDVMMPEVDGFEVCRQLRASAATREIPIIFLTAKTGVDDIVEAFAIGANDYVAKPFRPPELLARVRTHLTLQAQKREIAAKNSELKEMLHILCHDVANQFAVLSMALDLINYGANKDLSRLLPRMTAAVRNGVGLTNLVRTLRHAEDKGLVLQPVSLKAVATEALLLAEPKLAAKELTVVCELPEVEVMAELCSLTNSVLGNLLSNAIKFSPRGGRIIITATEEAEHLTLVFRDQGIGMPPAVLAQIFDVRNRSRPGTEGEKGTGFGMALLHRIVKEYGGTVEVQSRDQEQFPQDHGTEFRIRLKRAVPVRG